MAQEKIINTIKTVSTTDSKKFDEEVNSLLRKGWELHGAPSINTVAEQSTWDGQISSHKVTTYSQVLVYYYIKQSL